MPTPALTAATHTASDRRTLLLFLGCNAVLRAAFLGINRGEYTDGILQITQFQRTDSFWPPLYTAIVWVLNRGVGLDPIWAGRLVSWGAAVALVLPLWAVARQWGGRRAALWTLAIYTVSPVALRWSVRLMTDMLFACLLFWAVKVLLDLWSRPRAKDGGAAERHSAEVSGNKSSPSGLGPHAEHFLAGSAIVRLTLLAVLATLTRYQGLLLGPLVLLVLVQMVRGRWGNALSARERAWRWAALLAQAGWLALPLWLLWQRFGHLGQVTERMSSAGLSSTLLRYWDFFEMFLYMTPYILTLPVFGFFVYGLVAPHVRCAGFSRSTGADVPPGNEARPCGDLPPEGGTTYVDCVKPASRPPSPQCPPSSLRPPLLRLFLYVSVAILLAQSVFQSFQERYLLPLLLFAFVFAGSGMALAERRLGAREPRVPVEPDDPSDLRKSRDRLGRAIFAALAAVALAGSLGFGVASMYLQREAFGDLFEAAGYVRSLTNLPPNAHIYTNETYKIEQGINGVKMSYLTGRRTELLPEFGSWLLYFSYCKQLPTGRSPEPMDWDRLYKEYVRHLPSERVALLADRDHCPLMESGSVLALHSMNSMGYGAHLAFLALLRERYELRSLTNGVPFVDRIVPLLPDLMSEPGSHQQPQAWTLRYQEQVFRTDLFLVVGPKR